MLTFRESTALLGIVAAVGLTLPGCSRGLEGRASVSGRVTLDDQPLAQATVTFSPQAGQPGAPSIAVTNDQGEYELRYAREKRGAEIGQHRVTISTYQEADPDTDPPTPETPEKVPPAYAAGIPTEVKPGKNVLDFPLKN